MAKILDLTGTAASDGDTLRYNNAAKKWAPAAPGASSWGDLEDKPALLDALGDAADDGEARDAIGAYAADDADHAEPTLNGQPVPRALHWRSSQAKGGAAADPAPAGDREDWEHWTLHLGEGEDLPAWASTLAFAEIHRVAAPPEPDWTFKWDGAGLSDGAAFTGQAGTGDDPWGGVQGAGTKVVETDDAQLTPAILFTGTAQESQAWVNLGAGQNRRARVWIKTPATLASVTVLDFTASQNSGPACRAAYGATGQIRLQNSASNHAATSSNGVIQASTVYRVELALAQAGTATASVARMQVYSLAGTLLWDSGDVVDEAAGFGTTHTYMRAGVVPSASTSILLGGVRVTDTPAVVIGA